MGALPTDLLHLIQLTEQSVTPWFYYKYYVYLYVHVFLSRKSSMAPCCNTNCPCNKQWLLRKRNPLTLSTPWQYMLQDQWPTVPTAFLQVHCSLKDMLSTEKAGSITNESEC